MKLIFNSHHFVPQILIFLIIMMNYLNINAFSKSLLINTKYSIRNMYSHYHKLSHAQIQLSKETKSSHNIIKRYLRNKKNTGISRNKSISTNIETSSIIKQNDINNNSDTFEGDCEIQSDSTIELPEISSSDIEIAENVTRLWITKFVTGNKLCPWAGKVVQDQSMRIKCLSSHDVNVYYNEIISEIELLAETCKNPNSTSKLRTIVLIMLTPMQFGEYLEFTEEIVEWLENEGYSKYLQLATFHPCYQFADTEYDDPTNWTNRSPFPLLHFLRVNDVSDAIAGFQHKYGDTSLIWNRNMKLMKQIGNEAVEKIHENIFIEVESKINERGKD